MPVKRHDNFRIFAAMNPATDNGKKGEPKAWSETAENGLGIRINCRTPVVMSLRTH